MAENPFDAVVAGSGIAGLRAAIEIARGGGRVAVLTKDSPTDSATDKAQGGLAAVLSDDDEVSLHFQDTIDAGDGLCHEGAVRVLVEEGPARALELIDWGARFDREGPRIALAREAAHSKRRILRAHGDSTGREIARALVATAAGEQGITLVERTFSVDLILAGGRCAGILALDESAGRPVLLRARAVILATGGAGQVFRETTNPPQATGDGMAMAYRAGAEMMDLEFVQFHPTALLLPGVPRFLLSEAMRGEGGRLENAAGDPFMTRFDRRGDLAPRDIVARGIVREMRRTGHPSVYLSMRHLDPDFVHRRFPTIAATCARHGLDIGRDRVPVTPCAHYMMGGVKTDLWGRTSIPGLYAAGETACTGVHGANRLASNSLLEGLVFGARAGRAILSDSLGPLPGGMLEDEPGEALSIDPESAREVGGSLRKVMWEGAGILRDAGGLERSIAATLDLERGLARRRATRPGVEARNLLFVGRLIAESALRRRESRGAHCREDFPDREPGRGRHSIIAPGAPVPDLPRLAVPGGD
ncbi:MAG: L-aspartate oxidase [Acidobacteria bacterium]|nr:L-aspartate oxidase [Acidobacteriota bacterium]